MRRKVVFYRTLIPLTTVWTLMADHTRLFEDLVSTAPLKANRRLDMVGYVNSTVFTCTPARDGLDFQCLQSPGAV